MEVLDDKRIKRDYKGDVVLIHQIRNKKTGSCTGPCRQHWSNDRDRMSYDTAKTALTNLKRNCGNHPEDYEVVSYMMVEVKEVIPDDVQGY